MQRVSSRTLIEVLMAFISNRACSIPHGTTFSSCDGPSECVKYSDGRFRLDWATRSESNGDRNEVFGLDDITWLFRKGSSSQCLQRHERAREHGL